MNIWHEHMAYLQDNPKGYWFKRKLYGWGWTPATKAGWAVTLLFMIIVVGSVWLYETRRIAVSEGELVLAMLAAIVLFLTVVIKTGESPRWQWGAKHDVD